MRLTYYKERSNSNIIAVDHENVFNKGYFLNGGDEVNHSYFGKFYLRAYCNRISYKEARKQNPKLIKAIREKPSLEETEPSFLTSDK
jgi:hypothetical protein